MARNGSGVYALPSVYTAVPGEVIQAVQHNTPLEDLQQDANTARPIVAGGTGATTGQGAITALFAGGVTVDDDELLIADPVDNTKRFRIDVGNVATATTRLLTLPDAEVSISSAVAGLLNASTVAAFRGSVNGTGVTVDNTLVRFDSTAGALQGSGISVDDTNNIAGVGTISSGAITTSAASTIARQINIRSASNTVGPSDLRFIGANDTVLGYVGISGAGNEIEIGNSQNAALNFLTNGTLRGWFASSGAFIVGASASPSGANNGKTFNSDAIESSRSLATDATHYFFYNPNGTVGTITTSGTATAYNTSSDENLKDFEGGYSFEDAVSVIRADPVRRFRWKTDGSEAIGWGAQTSHAVSKDLATPGKGKPGDENYIPWGVDQAKRTPYLWAAVAGLLDRLDAIESRLQ